jgi:Tol biopolymer transport system component
VAALFAVLAALGAAGCGHRSSAPPKIVFLSDRDGEWALYAMDRDGQNERRVAQGGRVLGFGEALGFGNPLVSPDGRKVLVARRGLSVTTLATGASKPLGPGEESDATWSPDGTRLAFSGRDGVGLYVVDVRGGTRRALIRRSETWAPAWSPDGTWIAFAHQIGDGPAGVYVVHPDGSGLRRITGYAPYVPGGLTWSGDRRLAFFGLRGSEERAHLVVIDRDMSRIDVSGSPLDGASAAWSPDGRRIAYAAGGTSGTSAIATVNPDGSDRRRLTPSRAPYVDESPVWSPDGKSLVFVRTPIGGGAKRDIREVWSMNSDGSQEHPLTKAYPDGGDNLDPAWIRGPVRAKPAPRAQEVRRAGAVVLRVPFAVDGIAAEGAHAAVAPVAYEEERDVRPTPAILVWRPGHGEPARLVVSPCGGVQQLVLARSRLAFDCDNTFLDLIEQSVWVFDLRTRVPREVFLGHGGGPDPRGLYVDSIVGGDGLLAFGSERRDARNRVRQRTVWRIDGFDGVAVRSRSDTGDVVAAGGRRLAVELGSGRVAILTADGNLVRVLTPPGHRSVFTGVFGSDRKSPVLLEGRDLLTLERRKLRAYDTVTGKLRWQRRVPPGARLEAADRRLVVYTAGSSVYVVSRRTETIVRTDARRLRRLGFRVQRLVHAGLTEDGLFYCFNVADRRYPGRVVFLPRRALAGQR